MSTDTTKRKDEHLRICLEEAVEYTDLKTGFDTYRFIPQALPEINLTEVDMSATFLGKPLRAPILISGMTGGTAMGRTVNRNLAQAAQALGLAMGLGSQRAALENSSAKETFFVRDIAPDIPLLANLGAVQLNYGFKISHCREAIEMAGADALALHLNPLHEALQFDGNTDFRGLQEKIKMVCENLDVPVIIKGVGMGIASSTAERLKDTGIYAIDVGGSGGTCWALIEYHRAKDPIKKEAARSFQRWGIPTAQAIQEIRKHWSNIFLIGSGGVRTGIDGAKAIALGADLFGMALPLLKPATQSAAAVQDALSQVIEELRVTMFSAGVRTVAALKEPSLLRPVNPHWSRWTS